jgi:ketosteroid isomerase-like protein
MTSDNVERLLEGFRAMERGDVEAIVALAHPDVEFVNPDSALEPGTRRGPDGLRIGIAALLEVFEDLRFDHERIIDREDRVVAIGSFRGRGKGSGLGFGPAPFAIVVTLRETRVVRYEWFSSPEDALRAAGAPPDALDGESA